MELGAGRRVLECHQAVCNPSLSCSVRQRRLRRAQRLALGASLRTSTHACCTARQCQLYDLHDQVIPYEQVDFMCCTHARTHTHAHARTHTHIHTHTHNAHAHAHAQSNTRTHSRTRTRTCTHAHIHTHIDMCFTFLGTCAHISYTPISWVKYPIPSQFQSSFANLSKGQYLPIHAAQTSI